MVGVHHGATSGFSYHHQHKVAPAVTAALAAVATSTNGAQRGALSGAVQSPSESWLSEFQPKDLADNLSVGETSDSHSRSSVISQFEVDSVADSEAETVKMQSVLGDSSLSVLGQQGQEQEVKSWQVVIDGILRQIYLLPISVLQVNSRRRESCLLVREAIQSCGRD